MWGLKGIGQPINGGKHLRRVALRVTGRRDGGRGPRGAQRGVGRVCECCGVQPRRRVCVLVERGSSTARAGVTHKSRGRGGEGGHLFAVRHRLVLGLGS